MSTGATDVLGGWAIGLFVAGVAAAEPRIRTTDREALAAIHEFMEFQRSDYHAAASQGIRLTADASCVRGWSRW